MTVAPRALRLADWITGLVFYVLLSRGDGKRQLLPLLFLFLQLLLQLQLIKIKVKAVMQHRGAQTLATASVKVFPLSTRVVQLVFTSSFFSVSEWFGLYK